MSALATASIFGHRLRHWRRARGFSQIDLAAHADVSVRHLGFLETGRSKPSRSMVETLARALELDDDDTAGLHLAAGYVPPRPVQRPTAPPVDLTHAIDLVLAQQEPYPALALDPRWDVQRRNVAAERFFAPFRAAYDMPPEHVRNAVHVIFHPKGLKPFVQEWPAFARALLDTLHGEAMAGSEPAGALLVEIARYPVPERPGRCGTAMSEVPIMRLALGDQRLGFFTTLTRFAMPIAPVLGAVTIECFHPADDVTARYCRHLERSAS